MDMTFVVEECYPVYEWRAEGEQKPYRVFVLKLRLNVKAPGAGYQRIDLVINDQAEALRILGQWVDYCKGERDSLTFTVALAL